MNLSTIRESSPTRPFEYFIALKKPVPILILLFLCLIGYFGAYFVSAQYIDVGDDSPIYLLRYRLGSHSLHGLAKVFEPARRIDVRLFRGRDATVIDFRQGKNTLGVSKND